MDHPNIIKLIDMVIDNGQNDENFDIIYLVLEYCDSDLRKITKADLYLSEK